MHLSSLGVCNLRNIESLTLDLAPRVNLFVGPNGGGKTSILESAYLLSHAQSFRAGGLEHVVRRGAGQMVLHAKVERLSGPKQLGLTRTSTGWAARINGVPTPTLAGLLCQFGMVCVDPSLHALISGGSRERRQFLDWGVFHVEPEFWSLVGRYNRILRQRNAVLKLGPEDAELDVWDAALAEAAIPVVARRNGYFEELRLKLVEMLAVFLPELGAASVDLMHGWSGINLLEALQLSRRIDRLRCHTSKGPHRADWSIRFPHAPAREQLSRGQAKLCALACVLAQAKLYASSTGEWPVVGLDDLPSELDARHQAVVVDLAYACGAQLLVTANSVPESLRPYQEQTRMFHVEHGTISALL